MPVVKVQCLKDYFCKAGHLRFFKNKIYYANEESSKELSCRDEINDTYMIGWHKKKWQEDDFFKTYFMIKNFVENC